MKLWRFHIAVLYERQAKDAYYKGYDKRAIAAYERLLEIDPENLEALFDLAQAYSRQGVWPKAEHTYKRTLKIMPEHFRAQKAQEKAELLWRRLDIQTTYNHFDADSSDRNVDVKYNRFGTLVKLPMRDKALLTAAHDITRYNFTDYKDIYGNSLELGIKYNERPDWNAEAVYKCTLYTEDVDTTHNIAVSLNKTWNDWIETTTAFKRRDFIRNSSTLRNETQENEFSVDTLLNFNRRLKAGSGYKLSFLTDKNIKNTLFAESRMQLLYEPRSVVLKYRFEYYGYDDKKINYFSPPNFWAHYATVDGRYFFNKEELFWGTDEFYCGARFTFGYDKGHNDSYAVGAYWHWDIQNRLSAKGEYSNTMSGAYEEQRLQASLTYLF
jgi:tetratricopeptide (TPR) repeat protein